ncbi:MAG: acylneuraminate cytidylyltransferase family protein [bacterium]|nr:acylneuraminate cytidylyltransferase family protein [bacterium]
MKANSERVVGKNFRDFCGKPLFRWVLDALLSVDEIERVVINTDAREILASHGLEEGGRVQIRDRAPELCGDFVSMNLILADDIAAVAADAYLMTHTTNPLLGRETVLGALASYFEGRKQGLCDSLFSVNRFQTRFYREDASAVNHDPGQLLRTQDLEVWYEENSNLYVFDRESFARTQARIGSEPRMFETPLHEAVDIDDEASWRLAELIARGLARESA